MEKSGKVLLGIGTVITIASIIAFLVGRHLNVGIVKNILYVGIGIQMVGLILRKPNCKRKVLFIELAAVVVCVILLYAVVNRIKFIAI